MTASVSTDGDVMVLLLALAVPLKLPFAFVKFAARPRAHTDCVSAFWAGLKSGSHSAAISLLENGLHFRFPKIFIRRTKAASSLWLISKYWK